MTLRMIYLPYKRYPNHPDIYKCYLSAIYGNKKALDEVYHLQWLYEEEDDDLFHTIPREKANIPDAMWDTYPAILLHMTLINEDKQVNCCDPRVFFRILCKKSFGQGTDREEAKRWMRQCVRHGAFSVVPMLLEGLLEDEVVKMKEMMARFGMNNCTCIRPLRLNLLYRSAWFGIYFKCQKGQDWACYCCLGI